MLLLLLVSTNVFAWSLFGPKDYGECVLDNMKDVKTNAAANIINRACEDKFKKGNKEKKLNECVLENMKGVRTNRAAHIINKACEDKFKKKKPPQEDLYDIPLVSGGILQAPKGMPREEALAEARAKGIDAVGFRDIPLASGGILQAPDNMSDEQAIAEAKKGMPDTDFTTKAQAEAHSRGVAKKDFWSPVK